MDKPILIEESFGAVVFARKDDVLYVLLVQTVEEFCGDWGLPKGHAEGDESHEDTARREIHEETGVTDLTFVDGFYETTYREKEKQDNYSKKTIHVLLAETKDLHLCPDEDMAAKYFSIDVFSASGFSVQNAGDTP